MSIYEELGRDVGIGTAVDDFYRRVVADPELAPYFEGIEMPKLRAHQAALLAQVTGGPAAYSGRDLGTAHAPLHITDEHFDRVVGHLVATLTSLGVQQETIGQIGAALGEHRAAIVTAPVTAG
ncbi:group 1 truncated hemoglobin [Kineococcus sp. NUM-3379]